jgi:hypothetical protein
MNGYSCHVVLRDHNTNVFQCRSLEAGLRNMAEAGLLDKETNDARIVPGFVKSGEPFITAKHAWFALMKDGGGSLSSETTHIVTNLFLTGPKVVEVKPLLRNSLHACGHQAAMEGMEVEPWARNQ